MTNRTQRWIWWMGVPVILFFLTGLPYWIWNLTAGAPLAQEFWRIRIVPPGIFDAYIYFHWLGALVLGYDYGNHLSWFGAIARAISAILPRATTLPELWVITRWLMSVASIWAGSWCIVRWSGFSRSSSRILSVVLWLGSLLALSLRPGIFVWYWPFCILGVTFVFIAAGRLREDRWFPAILFSIAGVLLASVYPWFFLFAGVWAAVCWAMWLAKTSQRFFFGTLAGGAVFLVIASPFFARVILAPEKTGWLETMARNGIVFSRMPFLSNTILIIAAWIVWIALWQWKSAPRVSRNISILFSAWVTMLLVWFHTPLTGLFAYNDHFVSIVLFLSCMSVAVMWQALKDAEAPMRRRSAWILAFAATTFFLYILAKPARGGFLKLDVYLIHLVNWSLLASAGWMVLFRRSRKGMIALVAVFLAVGIGSLVADIFRGIPHMKPIKERNATIEWIRDHVPVGAELCAEDASAAFYGAHTGYPVLPGEGPIAYPYTNEAVLHQLEIIAGALDVKAAGNLPLYQFFSSYYYERPCRQFTLQIAIIRRLGFSSHAVQDISGCRSDEVAQNAQRVEQAIDAHHLDEKAFTEMCPFVIIEKGRRNLWQLPSTYRAVDVGDGTTIWTPTQTPSAVN